MADLNPIGSEKLQGMDKIQRILEISRHNEPTRSLNENNADYSIQLADGNFYGIVHEKSGYIVKKGINESEFDYIEPMKNRKHYKSYSQAMKKINLLAGELNRIHEHSENINLIGEQKKFVLKTPEPAPAPEANMSDMGGDLSFSDEEDIEDLDLDLDMDLDTPEGDAELDLDVDIPENDIEKDEEEITIKVIQKLTGKLGQKLRTLDSQEGLSSEDIKYVLNSIISAVKLENLSGEDLEDILANFEDDEIDYGVEGELDIEAGDGEMDLDLDLDMGEPVSDEELGEGSGMKTMVDEIFTESKIDKVLSKYFTISEEEKKITEDMKVKNFLTEKINKTRVISEIKQMSESVEQQISSEFILKENKESKFLGKTNKNNLVFEVEGKQFKVSPRGKLL
tara:strand:- start:17191 stop:18378 length:1188 start_codon:yes stop_codon:yes gene_type:complete